MNAQNQNTYVNRSSKGKRMLSILLCLLLLFSASGGAAEAFVVPVQAAAAGVSSAAVRSVSGLQNVVSGLSLRLGGMFSGFSGWLLSIMPDPDADPEPEPAAHNLSEVFWNSAPDDVIDTDTNTVILKGGSDENDGATDQSPVLTYERALELVAPGGKILVMTQETISGEAGAFIARDGAVEGTPTVLDFYNDNSSLFHVPSNVGLALSNLDMQDNNPDMNVYRRLALLDQGAIRIGENTVMKGNIEIELFTADLSPEVLVDASAVEDFASDVQLEFLFGIDETTYLTVDRNLNVVDLVEFPEGTDASAYLNNITLHTSLHDPSMSSIWKTRTKLGYPNVIQAYLAEPYDGAVYLSGFGNDANDGMFPDTPVKTFDRAVAILTGTAADSASINVWRQEHGGYQVNEGVIRIVGAPVDVADGETWTMPSGTRWHDASNNTVSPSWVERAKAYTGALVSVADNGSFTLTDITIKGNKAQVPDAVGSVVELGAGASLILNTGALLTENHAENGGGVYAPAQSTVTLAGGSITKCEAGNGGGIYAEGGTVNLNSGTVNGNAAANGAGVYAVTATVMLTSAVISGNTATGNGGGIYSRTSYFEMTGGEIKSNNAANGAGVYVARDEADETNGAFTPSFLFSGGAIKSNTATGNGGGVYLAADPVGDIKVKLTANGEGEGITGNTAANGGGVYTYGNFTVYAADASAAVLSAAPGWYSTAKVTGNTASTSGGGWFANGVDFTVDGGEITGNSARNGGGIALNNAAFTMRNGASVHDNITTIGSNDYCGAGVYMSAARAFRLNAGCEIYNNKFLRPTGDIYGTIYGGGVYVSGSKASEAPSDDFLIEGEIHDNRLETQGHSAGGWHTYYNRGIYKGCGAYFNNVPLKLNGGKIYNNNGSTKIGYAYGGGLYHNNGNLLICGDAEITDNYLEVTSSSTSSDYQNGYVYGGGLLKYGGTLTVDGATFSGNACHLINASSNPAPRQGGGIYLDSITSASITNTVFEDNGAEFTSGGALAVSTTNLNGTTPTYMNGSVTVTNTEFVNNSALANGAVFVEVTSQTAFTGCTFTNNSATGTESGALTINNRNVLGAMTATVDGCVFQNNTAATNAGAMLLGGTSTTYALNVTVKNSTFGGDSADLGNSCAGSGGAIVNRCANLTLSDGNIIKNNVAATGGGIYSDGATLTLSATEDGTPTVVTANTAANGAGIYNNTAKLYVSAADLTGNITGDNVKGPAVYNAAGTVYLNAETSDVDGVYLNTRSHPVVLTGAPAADWSCEVDLNVTEGDSRFIAGDTVVTPGSPVTDTAPYEENFVLIRTAAAAYNLVAVTPNLVLSPRAVYIDGVNGDDLNSGDKPTKAVKTFAAAHDRLAALLNANPSADKLIYVVNTVTVSETEVWSFAGDTMPAVDEEGELTGEEIPISGVKLLAYCPEGTPFSAVQTSMVLVNGEGDLTMEGLTVDANRASFAARCPQFGVRLTGTEEAHVSLTVKNNAAIEGDVARFTNCYAAVYAKYGDVTFENVKLDNNNCSAEKKTGNTVENMRNTYGAGVTVHYGTFTADHLNILNCTGVSYGAGVFLNHATADITDMTGENCSVGGLSTISYSNYAVQFEGCNVNGGGVYSVDSTLTLNHSSFTKCNSSVGGSAVGVLRGTFNANDVSFTQNGTQGTSNGTYGILQIGGAATAVLTGVTFESNKGYRGGALRLDVIGGGTPNVTIKGGAFSNNYSYYGGSAIYSLGTGSANMPTVTVLPDTREETPVRTQISANGTYYSAGAVLAIETNLYLTDADLTSNYIDYAPTTMGRMQYGGGAAISQRTGEFTMTGCSVTGNQSKKGSASSSNYNFYGAVLTNGAGRVLVENCTISNNTINGGGNFTLAGAGMSVIGSCPDFTMRGSTVTGNVINETSTGSGSLNGAGLFVSGGKALLEDNDFSNNRFATPANEGGKYLRGAAMYISIGVDVQIKNLTTLGCTANTRDIIRINSAARIRMEGEIVMDADTQNIVLIGNTTPIELTGPLNAFEGGRLALSYDESFIGKPIVKGYTEDVASPELDAEIYLPESANPRFVSAPEPTAQQLMLVPGEQDYDHDIVVGANHVYLSSSGVDDEAHGNDPLTPVKTFAYAKQRLSTRSAGANIIIVSSGVTVDSEETWSLEEMTDASGVVWQPVVQRYMSPNNERSARYTGVLINVAEGGELTLTNVKIDGRRSATKVAVTCSPVIKMTGGAVSVGSGAHITNNQATSGALIHVTGGRLTMTDGLLNYGYAYTSSSGENSGVYGGGVYVNGGVFEMNGGEISSCGPHYGGSCRCYGALVALHNKGEFYFNGGVLRDARIFGGPLVGASGGMGYCNGYVHGAVAVCGEKYNEETGAGVRFVCKSTIRDNFWVQNYATQTTACMVSLNGAAVYVKTGTAELAEGTLITNNFSNRGDSYTGSTYGAVYADGGAALTISGGVIKDNQPSVNYHPYGSSDQGYVHSCSVYVNKSSLVMNGGEISDIDARYLVELYESGSSFVMNGGEIYPSESCIRANTQGVYSYRGSVTLNGGKIWAPNGKGQYGVYGTERTSITINGNEEKYGEICGGFEAGVMLNGYQSSFRMNGGKVHDITYSYGVGVRADGGSSKTLTFNGGEIYNCFRGVGLWQANTTATFNKCHIHHNRYYGIGLIGTPTVNITSDDVEIDNNALYNDGESHGIYANNGTLNITGGLIHDNKIGAGQANPGTAKTWAGGIFVGGNCNASIKNCSVYNNYATHVGGGIGVSGGGRNRTVTIENCKIYNNESASSGGGFFTEHSTTNTGPWTYNFVFNNVEIYGNKSAVGGGGGAAFGFGSTAEQTMNVTMNGCKVYDNTSGTGGGGLHFYAGWSSDSASSKPRTMNAELNGCEIYGNTAGANGGGIQISRSPCVNAKINFNLRNSADGSSSSVVRNNTATGNGGGIYVNNGNATTYSQYNVKDVSVVLDDARISSNTAGGFGGGIAAGFKSTVYLNNVTINGNTAESGGGFYAENDSDFMITQGRLDGNTAQTNGNGAYVGKANVKFVNNYLQTGVNDDFYLAYKSNPLLMYKSFTNTSRIYKVYPSEDFVAGDIVVHPTGLCYRADPYLRNFISVRPGTVVERLYPDIILGRIIFLDGATGLDPIFNGDTVTYQTDDLGVLHDGTAPDKAYATFAASKVMLGDAPGTIYVSGPVEITEDETWSLGEKQYLRRYCGFTISADQSYPAFTGDMFTVTGGTLTLESITVQGAYNAADNFVAAGSVFVVNGENAVLAVTEGANILDNRSSVNGAAVRIEKGQMQMNGGEISGNSVTGSAKGAAIWQGDTLTLSGNTLKIEGDVYLAAGETAAQDKVIDIAATDGVSAIDFAPAGGAYILVNAENPYDGRDIAAYPAGETPEEAQKGRFQLAASLASLYVLDNEVTRPNILELKIPNQIYLDGVNGDDDNDGLTPARAVKTLQRAYELIRDFPESAVSGGLINVVDTVAVDSAVTLSQVYASGGVTVDAGGPVVFKRYAQPTAYDTLTGFDKPTNLNALFSVASGGALELANVTVDGHSHAVSSGSAEQVSAAVTANAALIDVAEGGSFTLSGGRLQNASASDEANAGAVSINGGTADITGVIANAENAAGVSIYDNGSLNLYGSAAIDGGVYLAQDATYVTVPADFAPANPVELIPNRAFDGRDLARYGDALGEPGETEKQHWALADDILVVYNVNNDPTDTQKLELQLRGAVYIDGVNGSDSRDGATPETAVKTLKRAYTILSGKDGATIYVVDTVTLSSSVMLDHGGYLSGADEIDAGGDVQFIRYAQPSDYNADEPGDLAGFGKPSCTGALIKVPSGLSLAVNGVTFDGHSYSVTDSVARYNSSGVAAVDALLRINEGGTADISDGVVLQNNNNTDDSGEGKGGAIANYGTVLLGGVTVRDNSALYGSGVYQSGTLKVNGAAHPDVAADQIIHLTGTKNTPDERQITVTGAFDDGFALTVNFDDPTLGKNIAQFEAGAFTADVIDETDHFVLAAGIEMDIVKSADAAEPDTLELGHIHAWTGPVWTWASHEDENHITVYDTATATFTCSRCGDTADVTDEILDVLHTDPKCETAGSNKYTAVVEFEGETYTDTRTVTLPAIGHDWEFKGFTWTGNETDGYTAAAANYECRRDPAHKRTLAAVLTTSGNAPTCESSGTIVYTAAVTAAASLDGEAHTDEKEVTHDALGHDWGTPVWNWTEATVDGETVFTRVTCTVPCKRDHAHDLVYATDFEGAMHVTLTETQRTPAECTSDGSVTYVATVDANTDLTDTRTVTLPATGHDWDFENIEWSWTKEIVDGEAVWHVTATVTCLNNETHKWTEIAAVTGPQIVTPAGETTPGEQKYTAEVTFTDETGSHGPYYDNKFEPIPPYGHTHEWTGPVWTWTSHSENGIIVYDSATATFTCTGCGDVVNVPDDELDVVTVSAGCEQTGSAEYTAAVEFGGNTYTDSKTVELPALGHDWVFTGFTWTGNNTDGYTAAVANYECSRSPAEKRTVDAVVSAETTAPTCLSTGKTVYTAVVSAENSLDGKRHTEDKTVVIRTVDHNWTGPAWSWFETTDGWNASAVFTCDVTDPAHIELPPVTVTYEETVHPTVDQPGKGVYTAVTVFGGETYTDTKEVDIDPLGHKFVGPEWTWFGSDEEGWEAEATFTCINETGHVEKPPVTMSNEITKRPTCEGTGTRTYTATTVFEGKTYTAAKDVTLPPIGHDWGTPEGVWHGRDITVTVTCRNDPSHVLILDADVTEVVLEEPWCTTAGLSHLTATVIFQGETYTWEKDYVLPALGHNWGPWVVVREATFEEDGLERRECLRCGLVEERVIPWNGEATREIQFVVSYPMHYTAHMRNNEYYSVYSETIPVIYWYPDQPLQFHILIYSNWGLAGYIVSANGKEIKPDENGVYTIPPGEEKVQINCDPIVTATSDGQELCEYCGKVHPSTVWGFLVGMMHRLFSFIKNIGR